jgi:predicted PurR-regulated permease PerM
VLIPSEPEASRRGALAGIVGRGWEPLVPWLIATIVAAWLYFGRSVLIPIILAILLSFLLAPIVAGFRRARLPRVPSVLLAVLLALGGIGVTGAIIVSQVTTLSKDAPAYAERIADKAASVRAGLRSRFGFLTRESRQGGSGHRDAQRARRQGARQLPTGGSEAIPVEVHEPPPTAIEEIKTIVLPALAPVETALIVIIVTIFILFQKEDLRDRLIRLMGSTDLHRTTAALDEGAKRLSRYFLSQFMVNCGFGAVIWGGLFLLGVPSPGFWGILAGLLRFVPYVGSIVAAVGPMALAAAIDPGWGLVVYVALLFVIVEPLVGYAVEPMLYGHSTGLSPVSVVVAALFWTWIWGPIGLVLSMPLTLMLVVLGRHIPAFSIFDILLGDRPALTPAETFYQRALSGHPDVSIEQAEDLLESQTLAEYYDNVVLAGLRLAAADVDRGAVERSSMRAVCDATIELLTVLVDHTDVVDATPADGDPGTQKARLDLAGRSVVCFPGPGPLDAAVAAMAVQLLRLAGCDAREQSRDRLRGTGLDAFDPGDADAICILGLFDSRAARRFEPVVRSIEARYASVRIVIGVQRIVGANAGAGMAPTVEVSLAATIEAVRGIRSTG